MAKLTWKKLSWNDEDVSGGQQPAAFGPIRRLVVSGDSISDYRVGLADVTGMSASAGIVTASGAFSWPAGQQVQLAGAASAAFNGIGRVLTGGTSFTVGMPGAEGATGKKHAALNMQAKYGTISTGVFWGCAGQKAPAPDVVLLASRSSATSVQLQERLESEVFTQNFDTLLLMAGTNDLGSRSAQEIAGTILDMCDACLARGIQVILCAITPGSTEGNATLQVKRNEVNALLGAGASARSKVLFVDTASPLVEQADEHRRGKPGYYAADGVHLNDKGHYLIGAALAPVFRQYAEDCSLGAENIMSNSDFSSGSVNPVGFAINTQGGAYTYAGSVAGGVWTVNVSGASAGERVTFYAAPVTYTASAAKSVYVSAELKTSADCEVQFLVPKKINGTSFNSSDYNGMLFADGDFARIITRGYKLAAGEELQIGGSSFNCVFNSPGDYVLQLRNPQVLVK